MVEFLREHWLLSMVATYVLGQITMVLVLGGLIPRDPGNAVEGQQPERGRSEPRNRGRSPHRPRRSSGAHSLRNIARPLMGGRLRTLEDHPSLRLN